MSIPIGVSIDEGVFIVEFSYSSTTPSDSGTSVQSYSASSVSEAKLEKNTARKTGAVIGPYEPEISAMLAGEI